MIDIHCHILPNLDDGSKSMEESLQMAEAAVAEGITAIIATPHHANGAYNNEANAIRQAVLEMTHELQARQIPLEIVCGQEIRVYNKLVNDYYENLLLPLHRSRYMLIEFPSNSIPVHIAELIHELSVLDIQPIIAHPERNAVIAQDPGKLVELIEAGALSQVTAQSVNGGFSSKLNSIALQLCRQKLVHFIASDAHNLKERAFGLRQAYETIELKLGVPFADYYRHNAQKLFAEQEVDVWEPKRVRKSWFFWLPVGKETKGAKV